MSAHMWGTSGPAQLQHLSPSSAMHYQLQKEPEGKQSLSVREILLMMSLLVFRVKLKTTTTTKLGLQFFLLKDCFSDKKRQTVST